MTEFCLCKEHQDMITDLPFEQLLELSNQSNTFIGQLDALIMGLDDPIYTIAAPIFLEWKGTPMAEILANFKKTRDNAKAAYDFVQAEITKRLDEAPSHRVLSPGREDHTITCDEKGNTYNKVKKYE